MKHLEHHISPMEVYQWVHWSHVNNAQILKQEKRKNDPFYAKGYAHAERQAASQQAILDYLRHGTIHRSPNFDTWLNYWVWWAILMKFTYNPFFFDDKGNHSTFNRLQTWLRIARDEALDVETEAEPQRPVQLLDKEPPSLEWFDMEQAS